MNTNTKNCEICGMEFPQGRGVGQRAWALTKYCSRKCFGVAHSTHGHTRPLTPTYRAWVNMRTRCENPKASKYAYYGGRGIIVCEQWKSFENFLADVGERPSAKHSIDRHPDINGHYEPGNVRWATKTEQCRNRRSNRPVVRDDGRRFNSLAEAAESVNGTIIGIWDNCAGKTKSHRGREWRYA